ncbi:DUF1214 domain-containing protein [Novosphingobium colocasiae]|uniref:DUF1214 domain-containing protein n=1 Tax=Novosphingobium colocasiae TaxID=1256513 RepID=UPI0035B22210
MENISNIPSTDEISAGDGSLLTWEGYVDLLRSASDVEITIPGPQGDQIRADLYRQFAMTLSQGYFLYFQSDPMHPEWSPCWNSVFLAQPNPDDVYYYAPIEDSGVYRVVGERGTSPIVNFTVGNYLWGLGTEPGPAFGDFELDKMEMDDQGNFEIIFSMERPEGHTGNWIPLKPTSSYILLRQRSYDWGRERDVRIAIERLNAPEVKPHMAKEVIDKHLRQLFGGYVRRMSSLALEWVNRTSDQGFVNKFNINKYSEGGASASWPQVYWECVYEFAEDEALILETEIPETHKYWNIQVTDAIWNQVEMVYRQSSLNGHQARIDGDGKFRAVVSATDPGVANWLDTGGSRYGMLIGRWYGCNRHPTPQLRKVKLADLESQLSGDTPLISRQERAEALRQRRIGAQLRRRW